MGGWRAFLTAGDIIPFMTMPSVNYIGCIGQSVGPNLYAAFCCFEFLALNFSPNIIFIGINSTPF